MTPPCCRKLTEEENATAAIFASLKRDLDEHLKGKRPSRIICLGLGHFSSCADSRRQLALLLHLTKAFGKEGGPLDTSVFDPVFTCAERDFLDGQGLTVPRINTEGKSTIPEGDTTLFYLPHCARQLTNNLLWSNWSPVGLEHLLIVCNSFSAIVERTPSR